MKTIKQELNKFLLKFRLYNVKIKLNKIISKNNLKSLKLDLGCGAKKRIGYIGIDLGSEGDIRWDITNGLPFSNNSISEIRSDHFFEHIELTLVVETLK